jgi:hypothetical protein
LFLLFILAPFALFSQVFEGVVTDYDGGVALAGVVLRNIETNQGALSGIDGKFKIRASKDDEIEFSYLGYYSFRMRVPESGVYRQVTLKKKLFELDDIVIRPDYTPYQLDSIERRKTYNLALNRGFASSSVLGSVFSPVSALAEQFDKKSKQIKRFQQNYFKWEDQKFIDTRYSFGEVSKLTGFTGDTLAAFIAAYPMPVDYARTATDMEIKMWIRYNYREWIKKPIVIPPGISIPNSEADTLKKP